MFVPAYRQQVRRRGIVRWVVGVSILGYLGALIGYPVAGRVAARHGAAAFPCQDHACGCSSAEQCWGGCCCFTPRQKLDWAHEHGVAPPDAVLAQLAAIAAGANGERQARGCCAQKMGKASACCHHEAGHESPDHQSIGEHVEDDHESIVAHVAHDDEHADEGDEPCGVRLVIGSLARHCQGLSTLWLTTGAALPPPKVVSWEHSADVLEWLHAAACMNPHFFSDPPVPPPRLAA